MIIKLSAFGGSGDLPQLATDTTYFTDRGVNYREPFVEVTGIDPSSGPVTALSLTGKFNIQYLNLLAIGSGETLTIKITIDGVVRIDDTFTTNGTAATPIIGGLNNDTTNTIQEKYACNSTFLLELTTSTDTSVTLRFSARPII